MWSLSLFVFWLYLDVIILIQIILLCHHIVFCLTIYSFHNSYCKKFLIIIIICRDFSEKLKYDVRDVLYLFWFRLKFGLLAGIIISRPVTLHLINWIISISINNYLAETCITINSFSLKSFFNSKPSRQEKMLFF